MTEEALLPAAVRALVRVSRVVEAASGDLGIADFRVLSIIDGGETSPSAVAARLLRSRPTVSSTLDSLGKRGLILRVGVPDDARAVALSLSEEGTDLLRHAERRMSRQLELLCERTTDPGRVISALAALDAAMEAAVTERRLRAASSPEPPVTTVPQ